MHAHTPMGSSFPVSSIPSLPKRLSFIGCMFPFVCVHVCLCVLPSCRAVHVRGATGPFFLSMYGVGRPAPPPPHNGPSEASADNTTSPYKRRPTCAHPHARTCPCTHTRTNTHTHMVYLKFTLLYPHTYSHTHTLFTKRRMRTTHSRACSYVLKLRNRSTYPFFLMGTTGQKATAHAPVLPPGTAPCCVCCLLA